jgi:glucose/arabinose dehydrogenase/photosystem II stability/assembly factor-like uncharacterized protein
MGTERIFQPKKLPPILTSLGLASGLLALSLVLVAGTARAQAGSISGTVTYYGGVTGMHTVWVAVFTDTQQAPVASTGIPAPAGVYTFTALADGTYYVHAYLDADDSGGAPDVGEPFAWYDTNSDGIPDPVVVTGTGAVSGIDIALSDPWQPLGGLVGQVNGLALHPNIPGTLYAAVGVPHGGGKTRVYKSADGAASWTPVYTATVDKLHALAATGTQVYAAGEGRHGQALIVKSGDGGTNWTPVFTGTEGDQTVFRVLAIDPVTATTVYAAGLEWGPPTYEATGMVYRSLDGGTTWTRVLTVAAGCCWADLYALAVNPVTPTIVYAAGYASDPASSYAVIHRTEDGGTSWTPVYTETGPGGRLQQFTSLAVHPLTPTTVFAGTGFGPKYVYRSTDGGLDQASWTKVFTDSGFRLIIEPPNTVYTTDDWREIHRSAEGGEPGTWNKVGGDTPCDIRSFATDAATSPATLYVGCLAEGVYKSTDGGANWEARNVGIEPTFRPRDIDVDPQNRDKLFVAAGCDGGWMSSDGGQTWTQPRVADCVGAFAINPQDTTIVYSGAYDDRGGTVMRSDDGGLHFTSVYTAPFVTPDGSGGSEHIYALAIAPSMGSTVYAAGQAAPAGQDRCAVVVRSLTDGSSWTEVFTLTNASIQALAINPIASTIVYAGGEACDADPCTGFIYRTTNGGERWDLVHMTAAGVRSIVVDHQRLGVIYAADDENNVHKSTDGGAAWSVVRPNTESSGNLLAIDPNVPSHVYLGGPGYVAETIDGGQTWSDWSAPINQGTAGMAPSALAVDNGIVTQTLYAGCSGVWVLARPAPQPGAPATVTAWRSAPSGPVGTMVTVKSLVVDQHENWVADGTVVTFTTSPAGAFGSRSTIRKATTNGRAEATLTGVTSGRATITVTAGIGTDTTTVDFAPPAYLPPGFINEPVVTGLSQPTAIDWAPGGRMFIAHQDGRVKVFENGQLLPTDFVDISAQVNNNWNRGMLGIAVHPSFPVTPYVYLLFTHDPPGLPGAPSTVDGPDGWGARVSRLIRVSANPAADYNVAQPGTEVVLLGRNSTLTNTGDPADPGGENVIPACDDNGTPIVDCLPSEGPSHSVGMVAFGHDGSLFVSNGEGAPYINPDPRAARAQDIDSLGGKILRVNPKTGAGYPDNPFYDGDPTHNRSKVWSYGLRNPFRFALDPMTNTLYVGDVGWYSWEEVNVGKARNFGWPCYEGGDSGNLRHSLYSTYTGTQAICGPLYAQEPDNGVQAPLYAYPNVGGAAVVLGAVYTGTTYPITYHNALFIADYDNRWIKYLTIDPDDGTAAVHDFAEDVSSLAAPVQLALGPDGNLYFVALNPDPHGESEIRRIRYTGGPTARASATPTNGYPPLTVNFSGAGSSDPNEPPSQLAYEWAFGDAATSTHLNPTHTYTISGTYAAVLTVTNSRGVSSTDHVVITVGNLAPTATIYAPVDGTTYTMGLGVAFSGTGIDADDGVLPAKDLEWDARFYFNGHFHSPFFSATGTGGSFVVPNHNDNTTVVLCLTATDSGGLRDTDCVEIHPNTVVYDFDTDPTGLQLIYDGIYYTTPFTRDMIVNAHRSIAAPPRQGGLEFISWSDGGASSHVIQVGSTDQAYLAKYSWRIRLPLVLRNYSPH